jgi:hypothetical protein
MAKTVYSLFEGAKIAVLTGFMAGDSAVFFG